LGANNVASGFRCRLDHSLHFVPDGLSLFFNGRRSRDYDRVLDGANSDYPALASLLLSRREAIALDVESILFGNIFRTCGQLKRLTAK